MSVGLEDLLSRAGLREQIKAMVLIGGLSHPVLDDAMILEAPFTSDDLDAALVQLAGAENGTPTAP